MKILYYDCFAGISGDMHLAAMIDAGVPEAYLRDQLKLIDLDEYKLEVTRESRKGIEGTRVLVVIGHHAQHHHRGFNEIAALINASRLSVNVKKMAINIFLKLGEAEAKVHGVDIEKIHFHEVGAVDSIVDIVGAAICLDYLSPDKIICSTIELGSGFVKAAHGLLPVPAPATAELVKGMPISIGGVNYEATTPTGAAILATVVNEFTQTSSFIPDSFGYGVGSKDGDRPNVLRVLIGKESMGIMKNENAHVMLECNIDDMNPEFYEHIITKLLDAGADDAFLTPVIMKKTRPGVVLSVLCSVTKEDALRNIIFAETTTLGVRSQPIHKMMLERLTESVKTKFGIIRFKIATMNGKTINSKPEYDDCHAAALKNEVTLKAVYDEAIRDFQLNSKKG